MFASRLDQSGAAFPLYKMVTVAMLAALLVGGTMMYIAWAHNPQCEIHCEGQVNWLYWILIGASWALPVFVVTALILYLIRRGSEK